MNTPFKQMPGRGNYAKTGHGLPSPLTQEKKINPRTKEAYANISSASATKMNDEIENNKLRILLESKAKTDSISAAGTRRLSGGNKFQQGMAGNKAANKTRVKGGSGDTVVLRGTDYTGDSGFGDNPNSKGKKTVYTRQNPVEKDFTKLTKNKKTGEY